MDAANIDATVAALWRVESPRVLARLARFVGDLDTAEELAQDTFVAAIEKWRQDGVPDNPAAWLHTTARYLAVDRIRRRDTHRTKVRVVAAASPQVVEHDLAELTDGDLADDLLGLIFMAAHPILSPDARSALTLKLVCGLDTEDIARAFLVPAATIAQRVVRAKRTLSAANIRFELPGPSERPARLAAVREVIYLVFNEGYSATSGDSWMRTDLCAEALRLGRMLASLTPHDTESLGLLALIELQASRLKARTGPSGEPCSSWTKTAPAGTTSSSAAESPPSSASSNWAAAPDPTPCRPPSQPATHAPPPPRTPTGSASRRSTTA
jgi:RNA polymerase sigma factor (sigma-70 family)